MDQIGMHVDFDDKDARVIGYLVEHFNQHGEHVTTEEISAETNLASETVKTILQRFARYEMMSRVNRGKLWCIEAQLLSVADQLRVPSPDERDFPREIERWFRSKWWSVPVWVVLLGLPALVGYITMVRILLDWLSIMAK